MNILEKLPIEMRDKILLELEPEDIYSFWNCSRSARSLIMHVYFWKVKFRMDGFQLTNKLRSSPIYTKLRELFNFWQASYLFILFLNYNWKNNIFTMTEFDESIDINMINYVSDESIVVTVGEYPDYELFLLNSSTGKLENWIGPTQHTAANVYGELLVFAEDQTVKVWNLNSRSWVFNLLIFNETHDIVKIFAHKNLFAILFRNYVCYLVSLSDLFDISNFLNLNNRFDLTNDIYIRVWQFNHNNLHDLYFHKNLVVCLYNYGKINVINFEDSSSNELICCNSSFSNISMKNKYLVSLCTDKHVCIWDVETSSKFFLFTLEGTAYPTNVIYFLDENKFAFLFLHCPITIAEVWHCETRSQLFRIDNKKDIESILSNSRFIFIFSNNSRLVNFWCALTGKYVGSLNLPSSPELGNMKFSTVSVTDTQLFLYCCDDPNRKEFYILDYEHAIKIEY